jgi:hypothetical protein
MIISDLQYIETVENSDVQGGWFDFSFADAQADAIAVGNLSVALTKTFSAAVPGGAQSSSRSTAVSASGFKDKKDDKKKDDKKDKKDKKYKKH